MRLSRFRFCLAFLFLSCVLFLQFGCRNITYGDYGDSTAVAGSGTLRGNITRNIVPLAVRSTVRTALLPVPSAEVWVEELPDFRATTDAEGNYLITGLPAGTFRVIAKFIDSGTIYKMRSSANTVETEGNSVIDLSLLEASNIVRGILRDENGEFLPAGTELWLWGEKFTVGANGQFETPPLPTLEGLNAINDLIVFRGLPTQFLIPVSFVSDDKPLQVEFVVPGNTGSVGQLPKVTLLALTPGTSEIKKEVAGSGQLDILAKVFPADIADANLNWSVTRGALGADTKADGDTRTKVWTAPATSGIATVTVTITTTDGKTASASLPILVNGIKSQVTYNGNGNTGGAVPVDSATYEAGANVTVLGNTGALVKDGFAFAGWNTKADGTGTDRAAGAVFAMDTSNVILYATWTLNTHTVTFNKNGGDTEANPATKTANHGGNVGALPAAPTRGNYTFAGWNTAANGSGTTFDATTAVSADLTVYAQWTINTHTVTFNKNGGDTEANPATKAANHGGNVGSLPAAPTRANYTFAGWNTAANGSGTTFDATTAVSADLTVYAQWTINTHIVTFNKNGGDTEANPATKTANHGGNVGALPAAPTRIGYTFTGWNTAANGSGTVFDATTAVSAALTVYAQWVSLTFDRVTPFSVRVNWTNSYDATGYTYKVVKALDAASIDTYAEVDAIAGSDIVQDWTNNISQADVKLLNSNTTYYIAVIAKSGVSEILYAPTSQKTISASALSIVSLGGTGNLLVAYKAEDNSLKTVVYDKAGQYVAGPTTVEAAASESWEGKFHLAYKDPNVYMVYFIGPTPYYAKLDANGQMVGSHVQISAESDGYLADFVISANTLMVAVAGRINSGFTTQGSNYSMFNITDNSMIKDATVINTGGNGKENRGLAVSVFGDGKFFVMDSRGWDTLVPRYRIYDSAGNISFAEAAFVTTKASSFSSVSLSNGNVMVNFVDEADGNKGKYAIYKSDGSLVTSGTFRNNAIHQNGNNFNVNADSTDVFVAYSDAGDSNKAKLETISQAGVPYALHTALSTGGAVPVGVANIETVSKLAVILKDYSTSVYWLNILSEPAD